MKKLPFLMLLISLLGIAASCDMDRRDARDDGMQREEAPLREAGDEVRDGTEDVGDKMEDVGDEMD